MELSRPPLVVAFELSERRKAIVADALAGASVVIYLTELDGTARAEALRNAGALLTHNTAKDLRSGEAALLHRARLIQFTIAGVDFIPLGELPEGVPVATNGGGHAEPMAEHALAMTLAAAKRLIVEHENLKRGQFNQFARNRMLAGGVCGIFGFGGIGAATGRLILVNLARGEIVQERPLYDHLVRFTACIDAWWIEPIRHGEFRIFSVCRTSSPLRIIRHRVRARMISACAAPSRIAGAR